MKGYKHATGTFIGKGGIEIFFQTWLADRSKGIVVISHGLGEHSGRYENLIGRMEGAGVSFYALDHRGHGRSGGNRGHVASFMEYIHDLKIFVNQIKDEHGDMPVVLLGHSLGGLIAIKYALTHPADLGALVLSSAGLIPSVAVPGWKKKMGLFFSRYIPKLAMSNGLDPAELSHDRKVVEAYINDPLVHDRVSSRWYAEFTAAEEECLRRARELRTPLLVIHGGEDRMVDYRGSERVYADSTAKDKTLHIFPGLFHETMNETAAERKKVLDVLAAWITARLGGRPKGAAAGAKAAPKVKKPAAKKTRKTAVKKASGPKKKKAAVKKTGKPVRKAGKRKK